MSIVRVGLSEQDGFSEGYDRIFGKKKDEQPEQQDEAKATEEKPAGEGEQKS